MAQNTFINVAVDKSAATKPDNNHLHSVSGGASASGDMTVSLDNTVVTTLNMFDSVMKAVRLRLVSGGLK